MLRVTLFTLTCVSCDLRVSGHSGQRAEQEQEAGIVVPLQEEVGLGRGAGSDRGGEDGFTSARPSRIQTQEVLPLTNNRHQGGFLTFCYAHTFTDTVYLSIHIYTHNVNLHVYTTSHQHTYLSYLCLLMFADVAKQLIRALNIILNRRCCAEAMLICVLSIFMLTIKVFL